MLRECIELTYVAEAGSRGCFHRTGCPDDLIEELESGKCASSELCSLLKTLDCLNRSNSW